MTFPSCVRADSSPTGGVRVVARDWPLAALAGVLVLLPGLAMLAWSIADRHPVEGGGAVVFVGLGAFALALGMKHRRTLSMVCDGETLRVVGVEGAGPWRRSIDLRLARGATARVDELPVLAGAGGSVSDRGADLVLTDGTVTLRLARGIGATGRAQIARAAAAIVRAL